MDISTTNTSSTLAVYLEPNHYKYHNNRDNMILSTEIAALEYARSQYPMMNVILISFAIAIICLCLCSMRGWKKYFYHKKLDKLGLLFILNKTYKIPTQNKYILNSKKEFEMNSQRKMNSKIFEHNIELTGISRMDKSKDLNQQISAISECNDDQRVELKCDKSSEMVTVIEDDSDTDEVQEELIIV